MQSQPPATSRTETQVQTPETQNTLRLVPVADKPKKKQRNRVRWTEDVVDNEFMNKKSSKICCIFHPHDEEQYEVEEEESESESSSSSSSSSDESDHESKPNAYERQPKYKRKKGAECNHDHSHSNV